MVDFRTEERFSIVTSKISTIYISATLISFLAASLFFLPFIFFPNSISPLVMIFGIVIFIASLVSIVLVRTEYELAINNDYRSRPPLQFMVIFVVSYLMFFFMAPDPLFGSQQKASPVVFTLLVIPPLVITFIFQKIYHNIFIWLINIISKISPKKVLHDDQLKDKVEVKFNEVKRYGGTFSLILISVTIPPDKIDRVKATMLFILFFSILRENVRKTDQLGIFEHGSAACILSNNNNLAKAELQSQRLVTELEKNPLLKRKLAIFNSSCRSVIVEYNQGFNDSREMVDKGIADLRKELSPKQL